MFDDQQAASVRSAKANLRAEIAQRRRARSAADLATAESALAAQAMASPVLARARRVAVYLSMRTEPPTRALLTQWHEAGREVIVPVVDDRELDWTRWHPTAASVTSRLGSDELVGARLGVDAITGCDAVVVPALAADHAGHRLGRGAGYYDRALARVSAPITAVVFDDELLTDVPSEPHDIAVQSVLTPSGLFRVL